MMVASQPSVTLVSLIIKQMDRQKHRRIGECKSIGKIYDGDAGDDGMVMASH